MKTNTRLLFKILLRHFEVDCVLDIGSCDGYESLMFRNILPTAEIIAFEANPFLYEQLEASPALRANRVAVFPYAMTNVKGTAPFNVIDVDYDDPNNNRGTSSLLVHEGLRVKETVEVKTCRIDEFIIGQYPHARRIGLWIDVEGAEFGVLEGMTQIKDRVMAIHVETARTPMRAGQRIYREIESLMKSLGFVPFGTNMSRDSVWGDVVFVNKEMITDLPFLFHLRRSICWLSYLCRINDLGRLLRDHCPAIYRFLWRIYARLFA